MPESLGLADKCNLLVKPLSRLVRGSISKSNVRDLSKTVFWPLYTCTLRCTYTHECTHTRTHNNSTAWKVLQFDYLELCSPNFPVSVSHDSAPVKVATVRPEERGL